MAIKLKYFPYSILDVLCNYIVATNFHYDPPTPNNMIYCILHEGIKVKKSAIFPMK